MLRLVGDLQRQGSQPQLAREPDVNVRSNFGDPSFQRAQTERLPSDNRLVPEPPTIFPVPCTNESGQVRSAKDMTQGEKPGSMEQEPGGLREEPEIDSQGVRGESVVAPRTVDIAQGMMPHGEEQEPRAGREGARIGTETQGEKDRFWVSKSMRVFGGAESYGNSRGSRGRHSRGRRPQDGAPRLEGDATEMSVDERVYLLGQLKQQKKVHTEPEVLETYHESSLYGHVPLTTRVQAALRGGLIAYAIYVAEFLGAICSGVFYIWATYTYTTPRWIITGQNVISIFFTIDYFVRLYSEPVRIYYATSVGGIIDAMAVIPIITVFARSSGGGWTSFMHLLQFLRVLRVYPLLNKIGIRGTSLGQQLFLLLVSIFGIVLVDAGLIQYVELQWYEAHKDEIDCDERGCITFFQAVYFIWVTVSTVGYGDITPKSDYGRAVAMCTILLALIILPVQIQHLSNLAARRPYGGKFSVNKVAGSRYAIVSGSISYATIENFLAEFYRSTHDTDLTAYIDSTYPLKTIILAPFRPSHQLTTLIAKYNGVVEFIEGSPIKERDLDRVHARAASAIFVLADPGCADIAAEDHSQIVRALSVLRYCGQGSRIIVEVLRPETQSSAVWDGANSTNMQIVCLDKIRFRLLARSCSVKGLSTFLSNLFVPAVDLKGFGGDHFITEYQRGFGNEVLPMLLPSLFIDHKFEEVADFLHKERGILLFGLDMVVGKTRDAFLFPRGRRLQETDLGLVFAKGVDQVFEISMLGSAQRQCVCSFGWRCPCLEGGSAGRPWARHSLFSSPLGDLQQQWETHCCQAGAALGGKASTQETPLLAPISQRFAPSQIVEDRKDVQAAYQEATEELERLPLATLADSDGESVGDPGRPNRPDGFPQALSLKTAVDKLLLWPPQGGNARPYPASLLKCREEIMDNLRSRTLDIVHLDLPHVLVCAQSQWHNNLYYFLASLRQSDLAQLPVVILHPYEPSHVQWGYVGLFPEVYLVMGSPLYEVDLLRAGVQRAEKIVVLADFGKPRDQFTDDVEENPPTNWQSNAYDSDVQNIVIAANVERLLPKNQRGKLFVEFQHPINMRYLPPHFSLSKWRVSRPDWSRNRDTLLNFAPPYMEGKAYSPFQLGFILRAAFYNSNALGIVEHFMEGRSRHEAASGNKAEFHGQPRGFLEQIEAPPEYAERTFGELFSGLLREQGILCLGLYRAEGTLGSPTPYVYTNPTRDATVHDGDLVFILR